MSTITLKLAKSKSLLLFLLQQCCHLIQINKPTRHNRFTSLLLDVYVWLNMFRAPFRPSSEAYNCTRNLWFYRWRLAVGALLVVFCSPRPTALLPPRSNGKTRGSWCSCKLLMTDGKAPETCWATHKRQVINLWNCCIELVDLFESYDDARTCERQMLSLFGTTSGHFEMFQ
jgi:hypothetical protein